MKQLHVVAGVIRDAQGRVLLASRTEGRDLAGLWEFPGGKVEPGETPDVALARELREELGIEARVGEPIIRVPQQYPGKRLVLDVREVTFSGLPEGLDGQALAWVPVDELARYPMPPADIPVVAALQQPDRYLVTPVPGGDDAAWLEALRTALVAGIRRVQLRAPGLAPARWERLAGLAVGMCRDAGTEVLLNGDAGLAGRLGAGLHLTSTQLHDASLAPVVRKALDEGRLVGASCHVAHDLVRAQSLACDFVVLGPVRPTSTHPGAAGIGWEAFARLREAVSLPIYAIGGLGAADVASARAHGAQGIAAIRALWC